MSNYTDNHTLINQLNSLMYNFEEEAVSQFIERYISDDAVIQMSFPFEWLANKDALLDTIYKPLLTAIPDLEKRT